MNKELYKNVLRSRRSSGKITAPCALPTVVVTPVSALTQELKGCAIVSPLSIRDSPDSESDTSFTCPAISLSPIREDVNNSSFECATRKPRRRKSTVLMLESPPFDTSKLRKTTSRRVLFNRTNLQPNETTEKPLKKDAKHLPSTSSVGTFKSSSFSIRGSQMKSPEPLSAEHDQFLDELLSEPSNTKETGFSNFCQLMTSPLPSSGVDDILAGPSRTNKRSRSPNSPQRRPFKIPRVESTPILLGRLNKRKQEESNIFASNKRAKYNHEPKNFTQPSTSEASTSQSTQSLFARKTPGLPKCLSEGHLTIMKAVALSTDTQDKLTGDFSRPVALPLLEGGRHPDLRTISIDTMANLLNGRFNDVVSSYTVFDCRYPYEFSGGHIKSAINWPHPKHVLEFLEKQEGTPSIPDVSDKRHIYIFHCEFSAERGPKALRLLREKDRCSTKDQYPALHFPELYILEGGYKAFFKKHPTLCDPSSYTTMADGKHKKELKMWRAKSKSWKSEKKHTRLTSIVTRSRAKLSPIAYED